MDDRIAAPRPRNGGGLMRKNWIAAVGFVMVAVLGIVVSQNVPNAPSLTLDADLTGDMLEVQGATDLPDGAVMWVRADPTDYSMDGVSDRVAVAGGRFGASLDVGDLPPGNLVVEVSFHPIAQSAELQSRYGPLGENMRGPGVVDGSGDRYISVTEPVERS